MTKACSGCGHATHAPGLCEADVHPACDCTIGEVWTEANAGVQEFLSELAANAGISWFDYQWETFAAECDSDEPQRACLYYRTGAGKSFTSLGLMAMWGAQDVLVIAPPSTHDTWAETAAKLRLKVTCISHAKYRQKDYRVSRNQPIIVDEFHLLGGHGGKGWKKLDTMARHLVAPLILMSATPNYNDADRVYCIQHVLDPHSCKGGFLEFLYRNCNTEQDPFSRTPKVDKDRPFVHFKDAAEYLAALPHVHYVPDELVYQIVDIELPVPTEPWFETYGYDRHGHRIMASIIEAKHRRLQNVMIEPAGYLNQEAETEILDLISRSKTPVLIFANHATIAVACEKSLAAEAAAYDGKVTIVTGDTPAKKKAARIAAFRDGVLDVLVGTASLATGTDGLDKVCDVLIILDDTDDDSLRRQLIGRIMPRGADADASNKQVYRIVPTWT